MAEFDSGGFSAVEAFFGGEHEHQSTVKATASTAHQTRHAGVGSSLSSTSSRAPSSIATNKRLLLQVGGGKHRRNNESSEDEESHQDEHEQTDDEEEAGRTAIAKKKEASPKQAQETVEQQPKKKKKRGKKERQAAAGAVEARHDDDETDPAEQKRDAERSSQQQEDDISRPKRKRHKIRSRQKNIYKDHRLSQHKPDHLVLGRPDFKGRPLTPATRAKLNLPPSQSSKKHMHDDVGETHAPTADGEGMKLAVDELLDDDNVGEPQTKSDSQQKPPKDSHHKTKKKKKRSKYKNLQ